MKAWNARLAVIGIFLIGMVCGAATLHLYRLRIENRIFHSQDVLAQVLIYKLDQELDLTEPQQKEIHAVLMETRRSILGLSREVIPGIMEAFDSTSQKIRVHLNPKQQRRFDEIVTERRRLMDEIRKQHSPPSP